MGQNISHEKLMEVIELRIADPRILRLIRKWLTAGVSEDGQWSDTKMGTPDPGAATRWSTLSRISSVPGCASGQSGDLAASCQYLTAKLHDIAAKQTAQTHERSD